jgi:hypothetical protein
MPDPDEILGDLNGYEEMSPEDMDDEIPLIQRVTTQRKPCLRETVAHEDLIYYFTKAVVTTSTFNASYGKYKLDKYLWTSVESFLVVVYVNNYNAWIEEIESGPKPSKKRKQSDGDSDDEAEDTNDVSDVTTTSSSTKKFTSRARGSGKYNGWTSEAIRLYNRVWDVLTEQRKADTTNPVLKNFDANMKTRFMQKNSNRKTKKHKGSDLRPRSDEEEWYQMNLENPSALIVPHGV